MDRDDRDLKQVRHTVSRGVPSQSTNRKHLELSKKESMTENNGKDSTDASRFFRIIKNRETKDMSNQRKIANMCGKMSDSESD